VVVAKCRARKLAITMPLKSVGRRVSWDFNDCPQLISDHCGSQGALIEGCQSPESNANK